MLSVIAVLNVLLGFVRESITAYYFGTSADLDAFLVASTLPRLIPLHAVQITVSVVLPLYVGYLEMGKREEATALLQRWWRFLSKAMIVFCLVVGIIAPLVVRGIGPGMTSEQHHQAAGWLRWLLPAVLTMTLSGCFKVVLDQNRRFFMPAMSGAFLSVAIIASAVVGHDSMGVASMIPGFVVGSAAGFLFQWKQSNEYEPRLMSWKDLPAHVKLPLAGGGIMVLNSLAQEANLIIDRAFASQLPEGSIAALNYAKTFTSVPQTIVGAAVATALFPVLSEKIARDQWREAFRTTLGWTIVVMLLGLIPVAAITIWRHELIALVFQRGAFGREATEMTASVVYVLTFMLLIWCGNQLVMRLLLAQSQHRAILISTIMVVVLKIILNMILTPTLGLMGVALATVVSVGLSTMFKYVAAAMYTRQGAG